MTCLLTLKVTFRRMDSSSLIVIQPMLVQKCFNCGECLSLTGFSQHFQKLKNKTKTKTYISHSNLANLIILTDSQPYLVFCSVC